MIRRDTSLYERFTNWTKGTIRSLLLLGIVLAALTPQKASSQFSDSTIKEINERLLELHRCRTKQTLYVKLAHNDSIVIHRQNDTIKEQTKATNRQKVAIYRYQTFSLITTLLVIALLI